jgi:hypothetical protein
MLIPWFHFRFGGTADMAGYAGGRVQVENDPKRTWLTCDHVSAAALDVGQTYYG